MPTWLTRGLGGTVSRWLAHEPAGAAGPFPLQDFERLRYKLRPADVLLVEGSSRVSEVIKLIARTVFLLPYAILPRRWRSKLFEHHPGAMTRTVCSSMLAEAFVSFHFPILPFIERQADGRIRLYQRNPRLFSPRDFDTSPYFDIIKYPYLGVEDLPLYRQLFWHAEGLLYNGPGDDYTPVGLPEEPSLPTLALPPGAVRADREEAL